MAEVARRYPYTPAGLGAMGRAWTPRLQLAGTYDTRWEDHRWPFLPKDFDFGYWNCAPQTSSSLTRPRIWPWSYAICAPRPRATTAAWAPACPAIGPVCGCAARTG